MGDIEKIAEKKREKISSASPKLCKHLSLTPCLLEIKVELFIKSKIDTGN
jgi:hypothetical protein